MRYTINTGKAANIALVLWVTVSITAHSLLFQAVKAFTNTADDTDNVPSVNKNQANYVSYRIAESEWDLLVMIQMVLAICRFWATELVLTHWYVLLQYESANNPKYNVQEGLRGTSCQSL